MKKLAVVLSVVVSVWILSPTPQAHASWWGDLVSWFSGGHKNQRGQKAYKAYKAYKYKKYKKIKKSKTPKTAVPELDPSAAGSAIVLMLGGVAYIASRRREEHLV